HANSVRVIVQVDPFGWPAPTAPMLAHLAEFVHIADQHGLKVHLTLFDVWDKYTEIDNSKTWAAAVVMPFAGDPRLNTIELRNEIDPTPAALAWANAMIPYLKSISGGLPVTISEWGTYRMQLLVNALNPAPDAWDYHNYADSWSILPEVEKVQ